MIACACLIWVGWKLSAPWWYYSILAVCAVTQIVKYGIYMGKAANK